MSYQVLARKWRPRSFKEMVGQSHILRALINALDNDRLHHAYLFTGTRGVGKTTIARILAKSLNCEKGVSATPCGECSTCVEIDEGRFVDLIEVDAASRTKVDETRELLDNVQYAPTRGRFKVYLIDEVHMFSNHSFNALLKTLEEPPPHVKFLLATTDPQKLPVTILSRCLQFNLKALPQEQIHDHLAFLLDQEKIQSDAASTQHISRAAQGSMRDALSLLDQAIAFGGGELKEADVCDMLGVIEKHHVVDVLNSLVARDASALLNCVQTMSEQSVDYETVLVDLLSMLQRIAIAQASPEAVDDALGDRDAVLSFATNISAEDVQLYYQIALIGRRDLVLAPQLRGGFEMILLRMLSFQPAEAGLQPVSVKPAQAATVSNKAIAESNTTASAPEPAQTKPVATIAKEKTSADSDWSSIVEAMGVVGMVQQLAVHCTLVSRDDKQWSLLLGDENKQLHSEKFENRLLEALQAYLQSDISLEIQVGEQQGETPAMQTKRKKQERQQTAETDVASDAIVQSLQERLGATVQAVKPVD